MSFTTRNARLPVIFLLLGLLAAAMYFIEGPQEMNDFEVYYRAGDRFRHGTDLYVAADGHFEFKYLPIAAAFFVPLSLLPMAVVKPLWLVLLVACIGVAFERLWRAFPEVSLLGGAAVGLVLARCFEREFANGQVNGVILLLVTLAFERIARGDDRVAGVLIACSGIIKPHFFALIPYLVIVRRPKAASSALVVLAAGLLAPTLRYGSERLLALHRTMNARLAESTPRLLPDTANASFPGLLAKTLHFGPTAATLISTFVLGGVALYLLRKVRSDRRENVERPWGDLAWLMPLLLLVSPQAWDFTTFIATCSVFLFVSRWRMLPRPLSALGVLACLVLALDGKLVFRGNRALFEAVMHYSPNAWVLLGLLVIAAYVRLAPARSA